MRRLCLFAAAATVALSAAAPATAFRLGSSPRPVAANPADRLATLAPDPEQYDPATHCSAKPRPGMTAFVAWLRRNAARGVSWGTYRCEKWGPREASLHAEGRAVDWHLDVSDPADGREARRLIELFLAPDSLGTPRALARRMGIEEIIWDCSYWAAGMQDFVPYKPCVNKHGDVRKQVDPTVAHRNHLHVGLSLAGAARRTTYWEQGVATR
ncbi:MAG: hypothetical protein QOG35_1781 [Solirubrobacteraceae bacterium]|jgi:hypothetical protein|nr:hypothetical protein [Solirubrobacteraceae bacterium]